MGLAAFNRMRRLAAEKETAEQEKKPEAKEELQQLRGKGKELGIPRASQMGEPKLLEAIAAKEAELQTAEEELLQLRIQAIELDIEDAEDKDAETLKAEIAAIQEDKGGGANGEE